MGRVKQKDDLWGKSGGVEVLRKQFIAQNLTKLGQNVSWNSEIWSILSVNIFGSDKKSYRHWLYTVWRYNRKGVVPQVGTGCVEDREEIQDSGEGKEGSEEIHDRKECVT